mmetsp:Transcript_4460/g.13029  ORF Transcript_4460/g.13029 Transcript_4460/m.13029 type:complete len:266 (-) Transcript_4460:419-1216(-)
MYSSSVRLVRKAWSTARRSSVDSPVKRVTAYSAPSPFHACTRLSMNSIMRRGGRLLSTDWSRPAWAPPARRLTCMSSITSCGERLSSCSATSAVTCSSGRLSRAREMTESCSWGSRRVSTSESTCRRSATDLMRRNSATRGLAARPLVGPPCLVSETAARTRRLVGGFLDARSRRLREAVRAAWSRCMARSCSCFSASAFSTVSTRWSSGSTSAVCSKKMARSLSSSCARSRQWGCTWRANSEKTRSRALSCFCRSGPASTRSWS